MVLVILLGLAACLIVQAALSAILAKITKDETLGKIIATVIIIIAIVVYYILILNSQ